MPASVAATADSDDIGALAPASYRHFALKWMSRKLDDE
jgi:hypothetical protein